MKTFMQWLEAARWKASSWQKPTKKTEKYLEKYKNPKYFMSFSSMKDKLGINPSPTDDSTPYGIYAYRVAYAIAEGLNRLPYGLEMEYIWIFTARHPRRIKTIMSGNDKNAYLWQKAKEQSHTLGMFNTYLLNKGIEGFIDEGTGTIHSAEPFQAVFFGSQTIDVVEVIDNNLDNDPEEIANFDTQVWATKPGKYSYDVPKMNKSAKYVPPIENPLYPTPYKKKKNEPSADDLYKQFLQTTGGKIDLS